MFDMWRDLETVSRCMWDVGSIFCATFSRASCIALMVASGVSDSVSVLHPGGASSLRAQSGIGVDSWFLCSVIDVFECYSIFHSSSPILISVISPSSMCGQSGGKRICL